MIEDDLKKERKKKLDLKINAIKADKKPKLKRKFNRFLKNVLKIDRGVLFNSEAELDKARKSINTPINYGSRYY